MNDTIFRCASISWFEVVSQSVINAFQISSKSSKTIDVSGASNASNANNASNAGNASNASS